MTAIASPKQDPIYRCWTVFYDVLWEFHIYIYMYIIYIISVHFVFVLIFFTWFYLSIWGWVPPWAESSTWGGLPHRAALPSLGDRGKLGKERCCSQDICGISNVVYVFSMYNVYLCTRYVYIYYIYIDLYIYICIDTYTYVCSATYTFLDDPHAFFWRWRHSEDQHVRGDMPWSFEPFYDSGQLGMHQS